MFAYGFDIAASGRTLLAGCPAGHDARVLAELAQKARGRGLLHIAIDDIRAAALADLVGFFAPDLAVLPFPAWDCLPYDRISPNASIVAQRIATLGALAGGIDKPHIILTTVNAVMQKIPGPEFAREARLDIHTGGRLEQAGLLAYLAANGYNRSDTVREPGEFAVRGDIIDLFPPGTEQAMRIDLFGDEIEAIRTFDPMTQITEAKIDGFALQPMAEVQLNDQSVHRFRSGYRALFGAINDDDPLYEAVTERRKFPGMEHWLPLFYPSLSSLFDYAPEAPVMLDWQADQALAARMAQAEDFYQARTSLLQAARKGKRGQGGVYKPVPPASMYLSLAQIDEAVAPRAAGQLSPFAATEEKTGVIDVQGHRGRDFADIRAQKNADLTAALMTHCAEHHNAGRRTALACYSKGARERLILMAKERGVQSIAVAESYDALRRLGAGVTGAIILGLEHGFVAPDLAVISEQDLLGDRMVRAVRKKKLSDQFRIELGALNPGDFVVHAEHGIGRYEGLEAISVAGAAHDCLKLIYDGGDKLFVPVENIDILSRYGSEEAGANLDRLGGVGWQQRKARVKKRLKDMADALIKIAAERALKTAEKIDITGGIYHEFAARFPYAETEDQARAIEDVAQDLAAGKAMDRLVCGDVGFGKTEVALRAAFIAAQAGLQVAVVVPTTLLARQHFQNFTQRFAGFPIRIEQLSRFVSAKDADRTRQELKDGKVDIVIGTHALLGKEVGFRRLGLLIIDEEQHFGVKQKERLKEIRADVHVLTLTATPIPRTLQLALAGVRELSLITTPPVDRLAVRTFVLPFDPMVIREAIMREHFRGGQSFYVCPRIQDLADVQKQLGELVPEARMCVAHGRMPAQQLEDIMEAFDVGKFDILLSTNIIESGLDIPNANTLIIHRADMFGLSQLYQLRGRVGRAKQRAYAYFTYAPDAILTQTAQQRLEVIQTLDQLGAGFQLASHDMDIRGAGNLLGEEQSGHIREVGVELYQQMLEEAVAAAREGGVDAPEADTGWTPQINLGIPVLIPETYVTDLNVRLGLYRRLAGLIEEQEIDAFAAELVDRFGKLPDEVENLLQVIKVKHVCKQAGIDKIDVGPKGAVISFHNNVFGKPERLVDWLQRQSGAAKLRPDQKLVLIRAWHDAEERLNGIKKSLSQLAELAA
ncbi:MAG: transcription-repair coupling factor [Alphaproteobacteria bacterium]|nr:transcription-repair coupling factor [Alphaproteobacteria bacterium]